MHGVIDIGSNSALLLLAERDAAGELTIADDVATITRISEGAAATGRLGAEPIARTLEALRSYRARADAEGVESLTVVATEGVRMAANADAFLGPAAEVLGVPVRVVTGDEEARLSYQSVALEEPTDAVLRVVDIGGASTELVDGVGPTIASMKSHAMGAVRLTEALVADASGVISGDELEAIETHAASVLSGQPLGPHEALHGLAGTVTTAASLMLELPAYDRDAVHGSEFSRGDVIALRDALAAEPADVRVRRPTLSPKRADVIVAGITILVALMIHTGASRLCVRDRGLRYALIPRPG